jgi:glycosyltransferase involved in cell wall biosynthesis
MSGAHMSRAGRSRLRIVMLAPFGIRPKGTLSARMLPLARALARRGHAVSIIAPPVHNPQDAGRREIYDGVPVTHTALPTLPGPAATLQQIAALSRLALAERPDVLHLFKPKGYSGLAALAAGLARPRLPLVVDTDDWEGWGGWNDLLPYPRLAKQLFAWQERDLPRRAAAVTVASRTLEAQVWGFGVPPRRVIYLPNGVELEPTTDERRTTNDKETRRQGDDERRMTNDERRLAQDYVARDTLLLYTRFWELDLRDVVVALVAIVAGRPSARLVVIGRGERGEEQDLLRLARRAGLAAALDYRGWVEPAQIPPLLAAADVALAPMNDTLINRARGLAKLLELMAAGLPIVAARVGQAAEYIEDGRSGLLVPSGDPAALARAAQALLADAALRARLGRGARERVAGHYTWDRLALSAEAAYDYVL